LIVKPDAEAVGAGGGEGALDLGRRKGNGLAESIDAGGELAAGGFGNRFVDRLADEGVAVGAGRQSMQCQQCRDDAHVVQLGKLLLEVLLGGVVHAWKIGV